MTPTKGKSVGGENVATNTQMARRTRSYPDRSQHVKLSSPVAGETTTTPEHTRLLLNRVEALESILSIQDKSIQQALVQFGYTQSSDGDQDVGAVEKSAELYTQLLSTWREKAISLMVQIKSMELLQNDQTRELACQAEEVEATRSRLAQECELWKQKSIDIEAQRDLERGYQQQCSLAETKAVSAVRTLSIEREKLQQVAEAVAFFSARENLMVSKMENLYTVLRRLEAFERRLVYLSERITIASGLVANREARLRNSEAAIDAERRIWSHRFKQMKDNLAVDEIGSAVYQLSASEVGDKAKSKRMSSSGKYLRPATEAAFRSLFHRLDPYDTGLVKSQTLLDSLSVDIGVLHAVGSQEKHEKLVNHVQAAMRHRSTYGTVGGNITWGELLLFFMPESATSFDWQADGLNDLPVQGHPNCSGDNSVPPVFDHLNNKGPSNVDPTHTTKQHRLDRKALERLSREELINQVIFLRDDRDQLSKRVADDARELMRRVKGVRHDWKEKLDQLIERNEELQSEFSKQEKAAELLRKQLEVTERDLGETKHHLESLRREILIKESEFARMKADMKTQREECVRREQEIWQKELQDVNFSHSLLKTENVKLELHIRQLERDIAKRNDAIAVNESQKVAYLEEKVQKR
uniref:Coiled-coil alpha-helical rod protein 1 n=1 Tax=Globisporangium ultimum (strain ATCC 200006 / CBS 805.95 / DAOM BR144) TaxID=431595 RepID=K3WT21_GLOUD